jgi:putative hydrolase of the HAD superfamily
VGERVVLWDFDGTLAWRPGLWSGCLLEILDEHEPGHGATIELIRAEVKGGFPWHRHPEPHTELDDDGWWEAIAPLLERALTSCGLAVERARELAREVRPRFTDASHGWRLFDDTRAALATTAAGGWRNAVLSNHVPELEQLAGALGLAGLAEPVLTSGRIGYEKPHPEAFRHALRACGAPGTIWMVGDNPVADVGGAEALGIPAILIRTEGDVRRRAPDALAAARMIVAAAY